MVLNLFGVRACTWKMSKDILRSQGMFILTINLIDCVPIDGTEVLVVLVFVVLVFVPLFKLLKKTIPCLLSSNRLSTHLLMMPG